MCPSNIRFEHADASFQVSVSMRLAGDLRLSLGRHSVWDQVIDTVVVGKHLGQRHMVTSKVKLCNNVVTNL